MSVTHTITEDGLSDFIDDERTTWRPYASSAHHGSFKKLEFNLGSVAPIFRVTCDGREIYTGALKETAVREYNALP